MADSLATIAAAQRAAILARERAVSLELVRVYAQTSRRIFDDLAVLNAQRDAAETAGESVGVGWWYERDRLATLRLQVEREIQRFSDVAEHAILSEEYAAVGLAREHVAEQIRVGAPPPSFGLSGSFVALPTGPVQELVGVLANGSPLHALLQELGPDAARAVGDRLIQGVATGQGTATIARQIRSALGGNLARAMTISRTETLRAYRTSAQQTMLANKDVLGGWRWQASLSSRTCPACVALSGTIHPLTESMGEHVRGRCVMVAIPRVGGMPPPETGVDWFARQSEETQAQMLGPSKYRAYRDGAFELKDLIGTHRSEAWGDSFHERSLTDVVGAEKAAGYRRAAR